MKADSYPLHWPRGWTRTPAGQRQHSPYKVSFKDARSDLYRDLRLLGARDVVLSTNIPTRQDGEAYVRAREPEDPGVAAYWTLKGKPQVMACDKWRTARENLRAIGLAVGALRMLKRTGATEIMERAFEGFASLPADGGDEHWRSVLGIDPKAKVDASTIMRAWREQMKIHHPDRGGSPERAVQINDARDRALREIGAQRV